MGKHIQDHKEIKCETIRKVLWQTLHRSVGDRLVIS